MQDNQLKTTLIEDISIVPSDKAVTKGDTVTVHYTGMLLDGSIFDSSVPRGEPFSFKVGVGMVITGWEVGLIGMTEGSKRKLTIPAVEAYGDRAMGDAIPANSTLVFDIELIKIN
jgi:FKBP-type peptidyl-prolyl cis-trans isomerase